MLKKKAAQTNKRNTAAHSRTRPGSARAPVRAKRISQKEMQWVVERLVSALEPEKIILFGSYAYGKPNQESDVDLLVVKESDERPTILSGNAYRSVWGKTFPVDILVRTPQWVEARLKIGDPFIQKITERGRVLYDQKSHSRMD